MPETSADQIVPLLLALIRMQMKAALASAEAAEAFLAHGTARGAFEIALDIEEPLRAANILLQAMSVLIRLGEAED